MKQLYADPWHKNVTRWAQTNITEIDPLQYDIEWWVDQWKRTHVQGVIINAGGIVSYYPSELGLQHRAEFLGKRDLFGEVVEAARKNGLAVLARMDSNRVHEPIMVEHPEWIAVDEQGEFYRAGELYVTCIHSPYYSEFLPEVLREIARKYEPDGFTDNSYSGLQQGLISYTDFAQERFRADTGLGLPKSASWDDPSYAKWIRWSYQERMRIWELNNEVTRGAGGENCYWIGMIGGQVNEQCDRFRDMKGLCEKTPIVMLDNQSRAHGTFSDNIDSGLLIHGLLGWDRLIPESMSMYHHAGTSFRIASKEPAEARMWMIAGFAGSIQPWWHHIGAFHEDRRQYQTAEPLMTWHAKNEEYLVGREPVADVGVVYSQDNFDFYGRENRRDLCELPWEGVRQSLMESRIPYLPIHADHIEDAAEELKVLVLPNMGALSDSQVRALRSFVAKGGSLVVSGETGFYDEWGERREEFPLAEEFGVEPRSVYHGSEHLLKSNWADWVQHSYLRLHPGRHAQVAGPQVPVSDEAMEYGDFETRSGSDRHEMLSGFDETDLTPFGGRVEVVDVADDVDVPVSFVPPFPIFPPETSWMRTRSTSIPAVTIRTHPAGGRLVYLAADLDRCYARYGLPDHRRLLANIVRLAEGGDPLVEIEGAGVIHAVLYRQDGRYVLHLVNMSGTDRPIISEYLKVGPFTVTVRLPDGSKAGQAHALVAETPLSVRTESGRATVEIESISDHEVVVLDLS